MSIALTRTLCECVPLEVVSQFRLGSNIWMMLLGSSSSKSGCSPRSPLCQTSGVKQRNIFEKMQAVEIVHSSLVFKNWSECNMYDSRSFSMNQDREHLHKSAV